MGFPLFMSNSAVAKEEEEEEEEEDLGGGGKLHNRDFIDPSKVFNVFVISCKQLDLKICLLWTRLEVIWN